jgi:signal transduction protein with GAF and PtsI domain
VLGATDVTQRKLAEQELQEAYREQENYLQETIAVNRIIQSLSKATDLDNTLELVTHAMTDLIHAYQCSVALLNKEKDGLVVVAQYSINPNQPSVVGLTIPVAGNILTQRVLELGETVYMPRAQTNRVVPI